MANKKRGTAHGQSAMTTPALPSRPKLSRSISVTLTSYVDENFNITFQSTNTTE